MKRRNFLKLSFVGLLPFKLSATNELKYTPGETEITIVYNNLTSTNDLKSDWGFSAWIKTPENNVLFDTGKNGEILLSNLKKLGLNPQLIDYIILSHAHHDHVGGLEALEPTLKETVKIYIPKDIYLELKNKHRGLNFIGVTEPAEVCKNVLTTGQHHGEGNIAEQAAILKTGNGLTLIHGCSHPGVDTFVKQVNNMYPDSIINLITGGFHLRNLDKDKIGVLSGKLKKMNVKNIAPSHCTGKVAITTIKEEWGKSFKQIYLGDKYFI